MEVIFLCHLRVICYLRTGTWNAPINHPFKIKLLPVNILRYYMVDLEFLKPTLKCGTIIFIFSFWHPFHSGTFHLWSVFYSMLNHLNYIFSSVLPESPLAMLENELPASPVSIYPSLNLMESWEMVKAILRNEIVLNILSLYYLAAVMYL